MEEASYNNLWRAYICMRYPLYEDVLTSDNMDTSMITLIGCNEL